MPLVEPFQISSGTASLRRILILETRDADGVSAWSECVAGEQPYFSPETVDTAWLAIREWIGQRVLGVPLAGPDAVLPRLDADLRGHPMAKAAVEMGVWGLAAEREGTSLASLIGGTRAQIATGISIGIQASPARLVEKVRRSLEEGYQKAKIKVKPGADLAYLAAVREELGAEAPLMADANSAYTTADFDHLAELDRFNLMMIEQPLAWDDLVRHGALQRRLATPLCLDESITSIDRVEDMLTLDSGRIRQHQARPGRRALRGPGDPRPVRRRGRAGLVRRHARERHRPRLQCRPRVAAELRAPGRRQPECALLAAGYRHARVDDGRRRDGHGAA